MWSPETLLCASLADFFVRALSRAAKFEWLHLEGRVEGDVLERVGQVSQSPRYTTLATLTVPAGADFGKARELLKPTEHGCLIANSMRGARVFKSDIVASSSHPPITEAAKLAS